MKQLYKLTKMVPVYVYATEEQVAAFSKKNGQYTLQEHVQNNYPSQWATTQQDEFYTLAKADMKETEVLEYLQDSIPNL